jgi:hypothetical protein
MKSLKTIVSLCLCAVLAAGVALAGAGQQRTAPVKEYEGQIRSVKIDQCGMQPGTCEGSIVMAQRGGEEVRLFIKPGTWIKRGDQLVTIDELGVGNYVRVDAATIAGEERATSIDVRTTP